MALNLLLFLCTGVITWHLLPFASTTPFSVKSALWESACRVDLIQIPGVTLERFSGYLMQQRALKTGADLLLTLRVSFKVQVRPNRRIENSEPVSAYVLNRIFQRDIPFFHVFPYGRAAQSDLASNFGLVPIAGLQQFKQIFPGKFPAR